MNQKLLRKSALIPAILLALTAVIYGHGLSRSQGEFIDAPHHLLNGIFVLDALRNPGSALADPKAFAVNYYQHFPAVNIGYYPPVFPIAEALVMAIGGVSAPMGQLTVMLFAMLATVFSFAWFRLRFDDLWAAAATALLMFAPYLVYWGRDIMLELPVLAFVLGAVYWFERLLRMERPTWFRCAIWTLLTVLAMWTKQHALMLLAIYAVCTLITRRWRHLTHAAILSGIVIIVLSAAMLVYVQIKLGGDAVGHSVGFTAQHVADRFNWYQWKYYVRRFPEVVGWPVLVAAGVGLVSGLRSRPAFFSILAAWPILFYFMHSYMKAQDIRYAILAMPPVVALAMYGVQSLGFALTRSAGTTDSRPRVAAVLATIGLLAFTAVETLRVNVPKVSPSYRLAAETLCTHMGHFTCLAFVPERAARPAAMHRLAIESRLNGDRSMYSFGRVLRAGQVLRDWPRRWPNADAVSASLIHWNVKFLLIESPTPLDERSDDAAIQRLLEDLAAREFKIVAEYPIDLREHRYPVRISRNESPLRTLRVYERLAPMEFNPNADPPIRPQRVPMTISGQT